MRSSSEAALTTSESRQQRQVKTGKSSVTSDHVNTADNRNTDIT